MTFSILINCLLENVLKLNEKIQVDQLSLEEPLPRLTFEKCNEVSCKLNTKNLKSKQQSFQTK